MSRRFQFSLRTLLVLVTAVAIWFAWLAASVRQQRAALGSLAQIPNGHFYRGEATIDNQGFLSAEAGSLPKFRKWMADLVGIDYVADVTVLALSLRQGVPDFERLSPLPLEYLSLEGGQLDRRALGSLKRMKTLRWLVLYGNVGLSDRDVSDLQQALPACRVTVHAQPWSVAVIGT